MGLFEDELRRAQQIKAQNDALSSANQAQLNYDARIAAANDAVANAQAKKKGALESVLAGIANSVKNVGDSLYNIGGTGLASIRDIVTGNIATGKYQKEWDQYAKKAIYGDENMSDKDYYAKTGGKALDAAATVSDFIPGVGAAGKVALNVGQGVASGIANNYIENGANVSLEDNLKGALIGGASSAAGQAAGVGLSKVAGKGALSKVATSTLGRGAISGATSGAVGGGLATALNGGSAMDTIGGALQGAGSGAVGGAATAGAMSLASKGLNKVNNVLMGDDTKPAQKIAQFNQDNSETPETVEKVTSINDDVTKAPKATVQLDPVEEAKLERKYTVAKQKQGQALMAQYGVIDAPTARSVGDQEGVLVRLYDNYGLETPADVQYAAKKLTGKDGAVTKMTRKLASSASKVPTGYSSTDIDQLIIDSGLGDPSTSPQGKALKQQIVNTLESLPKGETANGNDVLDLVKKFEKKSADRLGKSGNNYHRATYEDTMAASVLDYIANDYKDRIWNNADDISKVLTPEAINELKNIYPKNEQFKNGIDTNIATAKNGQELRHSMADLVNGSKIVKNSKMMAGTAGAQMVKAATSANPVVAVTQMAASKALESNTANKIRANRYAKQAAKAQAKLTGETPVNLDTGKNTIKSMIKNAGGKAKNVVDVVNTPLSSGDWQSGSNLAQTVRNANILNPGDVKNLPSLNKQSLATALTGINNLVNNQNVLTREVSRQAGLNAANNVQAQQDLQDAQKEIQNAQTDYNNAIAQAQQTYNNTLQMPVASNPGQQQLERISNAMSLALSAGDIDSYAQLADLYQKAYKIYGADIEQGGTNTLNATQQNNLAKLEAAGTAIDQLEALYNQAGGGQGRLGGKVAEIGASLGMNSAASAYNNAARGLINQIAAAVGKTDSLNTEGEVQRALDLVPKITDTPEEARIKLESLRNMLNSNKQTYQNIYGVNM